MFEEYLIKNNQIEEKKIKNIPLNEVKEKFEKVLGGIQNLYFLKDYEKVLDKKDSFEGMLINKKHTVGCFALT